HVLLPEREAPGIDLRRRIARPEEPVVVVQPARALRVGGELEVGRRVEAEALRVLEDLPRADLLADVAVDRVDRVLQALRERDAAERLGALRVARVRDLLAVLDAVAGIVERRVGLERTAVERGRGSDDLERRARRIETLRRAVEERRRERAA